MIVVLPSSWQSFVVSLKKILSVVVRDWSSNFFSLPSSFFAIRLYISGTSLFGQVTFLVDYVVRELAVDGTALAGLLVVGHFVLSLRFAIF